MENKFKSSEYRDSQNSRGNKRNSQVLIGAFIIIIGVLILLKRIDFPIPYWLLSWKMLLIGIGLVMGIKSGFKDLTWLIPIIIGAVFLSDDIFPAFNFSRIVWPVGLIAVGLIILTKGSRGRFADDYPLPGGLESSKGGYESGFKRIDEPSGVKQGLASESASATNVSTEVETSPDDLIECTAIFGGIQRAVVSKNFKGGEVIAVFGGADIDFTHADINGVVKLEATNILGGTKLIVPPTWDVQSEMVAIFGGVEDKRRIQPELINRNKRLILMGTAFLGGLEIKSF